MALRLTTDAGSVRRAVPDGTEVLQLSDGWQLASTESGECEDARGIDGLSWTAAQVPGTAAASLRDTGRWSAGDSLDFDNRDWWFRNHFRAEPAGEAEELVLVLGGIATVAEVYLNGERVLDSDSMFLVHAIDVGRRVRDDNELAICCRALGPLLRVRRKPRARWRTRLVSDGNLRFFRTMLLGRAPGFAPGPAAVGPWRPVALERRRTLAVDELELRTRMENGQGVLKARARLRALACAPPIEHVAIELAGPSGTHRAELERDAVRDGMLASGQLAVGDVEPWWPHTHGAPALHAVKLLVRTGAKDISIDAGRVGFRELSCGEHLERDGIQLRINDVPVFARGAVWTPPDLATPCSRAQDIRRVLASVVAAGMNMLRVPGTACYEGDAFYDLCDELGILVWQDFMFANLDYPEQDGGFMVSVEREVRQVLSGLGARPSLAVLCGGSEVAQQIAMLGLDPELANGPLFGKLLPTLVREARVDAVYVPSAPWGGDLPFRPDRGVANYYGVGAYLRPLEDARRAQVRFAAECLAFSNVPDPEAIESLEASGGLLVHQPRWKAGVPRDPGAGWDFEDVRDHYLRLLFGVDPTGLRSIDRERYLDLSRAVSGEVMAEVLGEWRREASPCNGALILSLIDLLPGAGWGVLDHRGVPKVAYHHLRRALAPVAVWSTDEGLGGIAVHVANDRPVPLTATLRVALYRDLEVLVGEAVRELELAPHSASAHDVEEILGGFVDVSWAYRFGPPAQDLIVLSLERHEDTRVELLSQAFRLPAGRPTWSESATRLGLSATVRPLSETSARLAVSSKRLVYGARVSVPGYVPADDAFSVEPGNQRQVDLWRTADAPQLGGGSLNALNLTGRLSISTETSG